ncbi:MAG: hypothetical protein N4A63_08065 [Vallitalea sp.]|jgi:hypothetical protein|nr:hypothetical protein [Vallitalea sp.]
MEKSSFFNSVCGDRKYKAQDFAQYFSSFVGNGVFPNPSTNLQVVSNDDMTVTLKSGKAWINGYFYTNTDNLILTIENADGASNRVDRVVLRLDFLNREVKVAVKKGTFGSAKAPTLQRDADIYELGLATIQVNRGAIKITQGDTTDTRLDTNVCGVVQGLINQVDTTTIFNQYKQWFEDKQEEYKDDIASWKIEKDAFVAKEQAEVDKVEADFKAQFEAWFMNIKNELSENQAGNLQNQINDNKIEQENKIDILKQDIGDKSQLPTIDKSNLVNAMKEVFQNVSNGKEKIAMAITDKNIKTDSSDTFDIMAENIKHIRNIKFNERYSTYEMIMMYGFNPGIMINGGGI